MAKSFREVTEEVILELNAIGELSHYHHIENQAAVGIYPYPYDWPSLKDSHKYAIVTFADLSFKEPKKIAHDVVRQWVENLGESYGQGKHLPTL